MLVSHTLVAVVFPQIPPDFNFPYANVFLSIIAALVGGVILYALAQTSMALGGVVQAMRSGHGGVGESAKAVGAGIAVIALLASLVGVVTTIVNWLQIH